MKLKQLLLSALAMVAATTGYAQDISSIVTADEGISFYDDNQDWDINNNRIIFLDRNEQSEYYYHLTFECESDIEVSFYVDVLTDDNACLFISFDDETETSIDNEFGRHITHYFEAGENTITFMYGRWEQMITDPEDGWPMVQYQRAEIYNIVVKSMCNHVFPDESDIPATCTEPSKSHCTICGALLSDNYSAAFGHDFDDNGKCQREGCGFVENRFKVLSSDFVSISIEDNEYPWEYFEEDGTKGLRSTNKSQNNTSSETIITLSSDEYDFTFSFDLSVSSEVHYDYLYIYVDGAEEYDAYASGIVSDSRLYNFEKGSTHTIRLVYSKDGSGNSRDDRGYISNIKIEKVAQISDLRPNAISIGEGVEATITLVDNANPWKLVDESDPSKGLTNCSQMQSNYSNLSIRLTNEEPVLLTFDYELKTSSNTFTATIDTKDATVINAWAPEKGQISYVLPSSTEKPHEIDFNYTSWGASQENVGIVISNIKLTSAKETLDTDNDGEIEVNDLVKNLSGTNPTPETLQKIEAIVWYILNKE